MFRIFTSFLLAVFLFGCKEEEPPSVTAIMLDVNKLELKIGETYQFKVSHTPPEAKSPTYSWTVSKYSPYWVPTPYDVATIDQDGKITAIKEGSTIVTVQSTDVFDPVTNKPFEQTCSVTIKPIEAESIKLNKTELTLDPGTFESLTCSFIPENTTNKKITWQSNNSKVVKVTYDAASPLTAKIEAVGAGEASITAYSSTSSLLKAECKVKVNTAPLKGLTFKESVKTIVQGEETTVEPVFTPVYATNKNLKWESSDETVAKVDGNGKVSGNHFGECTIKAIAEDGGFEATCKIIVKPIPVQSIKFPAYSYYVEIGGEKQLEVVFTPANAGNKKLTWSCSNPVALTLDQNGKVKGNTSGNSVVTAMSEDGGYTATCTVYVVEIDRLMNVSFPSAAVTIINGYYTGSIYCSIRNNSSHAVKLTKFYVVETDRFNTVAETTDESLLGTLAPGETRSLGGRFSYVYEPAFRWEFEYNGKTYSTYNQYGESSFLSEPIAPRGKSSNMIQLQRK